MQYLYWFLWPSAWFALALLAAFWAVWTRRPRAARVFVTIAAFGALCFVLPVGGWMIRPLEQAYARPATLDRVTGIIVLSGAEIEHLTEAYGRPHFSEDVERVLEFVELAKRFPQARLVFSGKPRECNVARAFFADQGLPRDRVTFECASRNTRDSAVNTYRALNPQPRDVWLLVTSASHIPRSYGAFRRAGWEIVPYPVAYRELPEGAARTAGFPAVDAAVHEYLGMLVYRLRGWM
jgi:uncharacterized SAM-binding protein YcdF (DUF218 family)